MEFNRFENIKQFCSMIIILFNVNILTKYTKAELSLQISDGRYKKKHFYILKVYLQCFFCLF